MKNTTKQLKNKNKTSDRVRTAMFYWTGESYLVLLLNTTIKKRDSNNATWTWKGIRHDGNQNNYLKSLTYIVGLSSTARKGFLTSYPRLTDQHWHGLPAARRDHYVCRVLAGRLLFGIFLVPLLGIKEQDRRCTSWDRDREKRRRCRINRSYHSNRWR